MLSIRTIATFPVVFSLFAVPFAACSPGIEAKSPQQAPAPQEPTASDELAEPHSRVVVDNSTAGVAQRHFQLLDEGDLEALLADYDDGAFLLTPEGAVKGKEALREFFTDRLEEFAQAETSFARGDLRVRDDIAYITWTAETASNHYELATDTFLVKDGRIVAHTFAARIVPRGSIKKVTSADQPEVLPETQTTAVLRRHLDAVEKGQMDELLADYTLDSLILTQEGKKSGKSGVEEVFKGLIEEFQNPSLSFEMKKMLVEGEIAYVVWSAKSGGQPSGIVTETLVIRDEKITSQTVTLGVSPQG